MANSTRRKCPSIGSFSRSLPPWCWRAIIAFPRTAPGSPALAPLPEGSPVAKFVRFLVLAVFVAAVVASGGLAVAPAQVKDKDKAKEPAKAGTIEVYKDKSGDYRFRIKDPDGKV